MSVMAEDISRSVVTNTGQVQQKDVGDIKRPLKLRFFVNGDRYFRGKKIHLAPNRYHSFNDLLHDLTGKLPSNTNLPYGVRQIFTPVSGRRIYDIADLANGETYVCAGFEGFKVIKYGRAVLEPWSMARPQQAINSEADSEYRYRGYANNAFHPGRYFRASQMVQRRWPGAFGTNQRVPKTVPQDSQTQKPKVITIVKNGPRPRHNIKILLNQRSVLSYEQLMADIAGALGQGDKNVKGQRLFGVNGKEVQGVSDFYRSVNLFIAIGSDESELSNEVVSDILVELYPQGDEAKLFLKEWEKSQRKHGKNAWSMETGLKAKNTVIKSNKVEPVPAQDKRDSGFDSSDTATNKSEMEPAPTLEHRPKRKPKKKPGREHGKSDAPENNNDWSVDQNQNYASKIEKQRLKLIQEERERVNRRMQRIIDTERKLREDEKRKREQVPIEKPGKHEGNAKFENSRKDEVVADQHEVDEEKVLLERKQREREEREAAERAARHRMAVAERLEREKKEKEQQEVNQKNSEKLEVEKLAAEIGDNTVEIKETNIVKNVNIDTRNHNDNKVNREQVNVEDIKQNHTLPSNDASKVEVSQAQEMVLKENLPPEAVDQTDGKEPVNNRHHKEKRKQEKEDRPQRKRAKTKIVRKTKAERQVSSDDFILLRYDLGKKLGDGNFAVVRQSKNKETGQEVAIKVIDKAKLKGKEHMVENEIDIMKDCSHYNIVRLYEEYETPERIYLIMELVKGGDLFDAITQSVKFGESDSSMMVKDMCNALFYLHSRSIVHRDLKPENLLVHRNKDGTISLKLADFGLAVEVKDLIYSVCGTPTYVAPEILTEIGYGLEVDMWAVGVITYIMLCGFPPFRSPDRNQTELFEFIKAGDFQFLSPYWDNTSRSAKDLISRLLVVDRKRRYSSVDVLCHKWIVCHGKLDVVPIGAQSIDAASKETRRELEAQSKINYEHYQKLKEKKKREQEKKAELNQ